MLKKKYLSFSFHWLNPAQIPFWLPQAKLIINSFGPPAYYAYNSLFMGTYLPMDCECLGGNLSAWMGSTWKHLNTSKKEERRGGTHITDFFSFPFAYFFSLTLSWIYVFIYSGKYFSDNYFLGEGIHILERNWTSKTLNSPSSSEILCNGTFFF